MGKLINIAGNMFSKALLALVIGVGTVQIVMIAIGLSH